MTETTRTSAAVAAAPSLQAKLSWVEGAILPKDNHQLIKLFSEAARKLRAEKGDN